MDTNKQSYVDLELTNQRLKELDMQLEHVEMKLEQSILAKNMITALQKAKTGDELLIPIGSGVFITAKAENIGQVKQAVGAGVIVDKSLEDSLALLEKQQQHLIADQNQLAQLYDQTVAKAMKLQSEIEATQQQ